MHFVMCKMSDPKGYILYDSIYMTFWKRYNFRDKKQISGCQGLVLGRGTDHEGTGQANFWSDGVVLYHV